VTSLRKPDACRTLAAERIRLSKAVAAEGLLAEGPLEVVAAAAYPWF
jgi:hypothetical protein